MSGGTFAGKKRRVKRGITVTVVERVGHRLMHHRMLAYSLYTMLAVGLALLLTAVFRRLRRDDQRIAPPEDDAAFDRRIREIETDYGLEHETRHGMAADGRPDSAFARRMGRIDADHGRRGDGEESRGAEQRGDAE